MIRPLTLLCFGAFAGAGAWLYQVKHSVALQDRELLEIRRETEQARQRIDILHAEWALLNEPERLRKTAQSVLTLEPMQPQHFARMTEFERRLPAAVAFAGAPDLFAPPPAATPGSPQPGVMLASTAVVAPVAAAARPAAAPAPPPTPAPTPAAARQPETTAARQPETPAPQALVAAIAQQRADLAARQASLPSPPARPARNAAPAPATASAPSVQPLATPTPAPAPRPIRPAVHVQPAPARPATQEPVTRMTRSAAPATALASAAPSPGLGASALGSVSALGISSLGRPMLAPPVPVGSAAAATLDRSAR